MAQFDKHQLEITDQQLFTDSFNICWKLLKKKEYYLSERETDIFSTLSLDYGHDMYKAMVIFMKKIINSNENKVALEKSKAESIKIVTTQEATRDSGYDDNSDQLNQQQQKQQADKVGGIHSKKIFKLDNKKKNCEDSSHSKNIQTASSNEKEETIEDKIVSKTNNLTEVDKMNSSIDHSIGLGIKSNEVSNSFNNNNQSYSNEVIENVDHQKNTRIRTGSLAPEKYNFCTKEDDDLSSTTDKNYFEADDNVDDDDDNDFHLYVDDDDDDNSLNYNKNHKGKIKITDGISFEEKKRVVKLTSENPFRAIDMLRKQSGYKNIKKRHQVEKWKKQIHNSDQLNQQQQKQQVDKVHNQNKMISKKRKKSVDEIHSKKMLKADYKKNNCDDSSNDENIQIASNENSITKLHMIDSIEKEKELFMNKSITIKDKMLSITDDSIDVDKMNDSNDHPIGLVIDNADHQKNTRIRTGSIAPKKYNFCTEEDDELSSTADENDLDDNDIDVDDDDDDNGLNQNENLEDEINIYDGISFEVKTRVVTLAREHPTWSLTMLRKHSGCKNIKGRHEVEAWKNQIERGGTLRQKINFVNNWVINKCIEKQKKGEIITNKKIKTLGLEAKKIFKPMKFSAGRNWLRMLKINHEITGQPNDLKINCDMQKKKSFSHSRIFVPHEIKAKVVNLANENPHWSLKMLREESGCENLENISQLYYWKYTVSNFNKKRATGSKVPEKLKSSS